MRHDILHPKNMRNINKNDGVKFMEQIPFHYTQDKIEVADVARMVSYQKQLINVLLYDKKPSDYFKDAILCEIRFIEKWIKQYYTNIINQYTY